MRVLSFGSGRRASAAALMTGLLVASAGCGSESEVELPTTDLPVPSRAERSMGPAAPAPGGAVAPD